ncbi:hypothetical protein BO86DRAFT_393805 [Aspergillus japonicus CBS 114.51]|uniref:EH domain-containing protein n=1 Tax=Aspergillus japonicus CBS 114.51 TaxID=1448312 RepID=A0A8T8WJJ0_ASPJA|nr:hypothetical protein BO86DRAFT_393805 [Aspergillus japonicus CBS 114.51]RAH75991.1 hypothetical protein BO86DRAFT_393805 [Aspergillus japonicus CBS 114.51]
MASSTSALDRRLSPHVSPSQASNASSTVTALQGATAAFNATRSANRQPPLANHQFGVQRGSFNMNSYASDLASLRSNQSPEPPEIGSVKDKIGKFSACGQPGGSRDALLKVPGDIGGLRPRTPQQIAAQLAAGRSTPSKKPAPTPSSSSANVDLPMRPGGERERPQLLAPKPVWATAASKASFEKILKDEQDSRLGDKQIERKPVRPGSALSDFAQLAAAKSRPPPVPRKPCLNPTSINVNPASEKPKDLPRSHPPLPSGDPIRTDENPPSLPPRPSETPSSSKIDLAGHRALLSSSDGRLRPSSPGSASMYAKSVTNSTPSLLDSTSEGVLSDAIVASSLASTRASQEKKTAPPPPPRRRPRSRSIVHLGHSKKHDHQQSSSPSTVLRQTLRHPSSSDEEEGYRQHKHIIRKHPHKHHEGDRKRWRSEVSEKDRKKYEGVWAANKGLLVPLPSQVPPGSLPPDASEMVVNLVVRDIWSRSELPSHVLEQIWNLVDSQKNGLLTREEFVVGMWLIDQQLKGHKLPVRVPDSVWYSVKRISGIRIHSLPPS